MSYILQNRDNPNIHTIMENQWNQAIINFSKSPHCKIHRKENITLISSEIDFTLFNGALYTKFEAPLDEKIDKIISFYKDRKFYWHTGPSTHPANLTEALEERGFHAITTPCMAVNLKELKPIRSRLVIEKVSNIEELRLWTRIFTSGFGIPDSYDKWWKIISAIGSQDENTICYTGFIDGEPVATSQAYYDCGVVGIYDVAVIPSARRKGYGSAITLKPLFDALEKGYSVGVLHSSQIGYSVYEKLGFKEYGKITRYKSP